METKPNKKGEQWRKTKSQGQWWMLQSQGHMGVQQLKVAVKRAGTGHKGAGLAGCDSIDRQLAGLVVNWFQPIERALVEV